MQKFNCVFNTDVVKPIVSSYVRIYSASSNQQVYYKSVIFFFISLIKPYLFIKILSLDASSSNTTQFLSSTNMYFIIPIGTLSNGSYYILFDIGLLIIF